MLDKILFEKNKIIKEMQKVCFKREKPILDVISSLKDRPFICEIKKASPTLGSINKDIDIIDQAKKYEKYGAGAISVLTDNTFFKGSYNDLHEVSQNVSIPVLCKDFILSEIQIENAYLSGADMILLIAEALSKEKMKELSQKAGSLGLTVLYEIHSISEFYKIKDLDPKIVGVNARNLKTLKMDKEKAKRILSELNGEFYKVGESGIEKSLDVSEYKKSGADFFLIGTTLMKSKSLKTTFSELQKGLSC